MQIVSSSFKNLMNTRTKDGCRHYVFSMLGRRCISIVHSFIIQGPFNPYALAISLLFIEALSQASTVSALSGACPTTHSNNQDE